MFDKNHLLPELAQEDKRSGIVKQDGYLSMRKPSHPNAWKNGYVKYHRLVMELEIGRYLNREELVHHMDHNKLNNDINNLKIVTMSEHRTIHNNETKDYSSNWDMKELKELYEKGYSTRKIAKEIGMGKSNVSYQLRKMGIKNDHKSGKINVNNPLNEQQVTKEEIKIMNKMRKEGIIVRKIAETVGYSTGTIYRYLNKDLISSKK